MTHEVFISYSSKNAEYANAVHEKLENNGIKCWLDSSNIRTATNFAQEIIDGINGAKVIVLIYSKDADESKYVYREIETASDSKKHIVPFKIDESFPEELKLFLRGTQWLDASPDALEKNNMSLEDCYEQLKEAVERAIGKWRPSWTLENGCTKTYFIKQSSHVKKVTGDNGFEYLSVTSKDEVEKNPSSFYYDADSKKLFLHPKKNSAGEFVSPDFLTVDIEYGIDDGGGSPGFLEKYGKILAVVVIILIVVGGFLAFSGTESDSGEEINKTMVEIGYIGLQDNGGGSYSYYVYGNIDENSSISSNDVIHIDFYDKNGKVVDSSDTKIKDSDGNILGSVDVSSDDIAKISLELQNKDKKVLYSQESDNIVSE